MGNVDAFLRSLLTFNKDAIPLPCVEKCEKDFISNLAFNAANIRTKSGAAAGLCGWVINICKYFRIYQVRLLSLHFSSAPATATLLASQLKKYSVQLTICCTKHGNVVTGDSHEAIQWRS